MIVFVGVNGVGKSTNLAKIAYWLVQNKMKVLLGRQCKCWQKSTCIQDDEQHA